MKALAAALATGLLLAACQRSTGWTRSTEPGAGTPPPVPPFAATARPPAGARRGPVRARGNGSIPVRAFPASPPPTVAATAAPPYRAGVQPLPQILSAGVSPSAVGSGTTVRAVVRTTPGVVTVTAFAAGTSLPLARVADGRFEGSTTLPQLPPFAHGTYSVTFVARDARGLSTQSAVGVRIR